MKTKEFLALLGVLTLVISIPLTLILVGMRQEVRKEAFVAGGNSSLSLISSTDVLSPRDNVGITIYLDTGGEDVYGFAITINFDPAVFEALEPQIDTTGATLPFPTVMKNAVTAGKVEFDCAIGFSQPPAYINDAGLIGVLTLRVKDTASLGATSISFVTTGDEQSTIYNSSFQDTLGQATGVDFTVQSSLSLVVSFENISPTVTDVSGVTVKVGTGFETSGTFTKSDSTFTANVPLEGVGAGTYAVVVKGPLHLSQKETGITIPRGTPLDFTSKGPLLGGDLDKSGPSADKVDISDVGVLLNNYDTVSPTADINFDGKVDMIDVGYLIKNYDLSGEE